MAKTTFKVGDKVRILNAKKIKNAVKDGFKSGEVYPVTRIYDDGRPVIEHETDLLAFFQDELQYIEKVEESDAKMTQFKVGDKVRVINANASKHSNGDEGVVVSITPIWGVVFIDVDVNGVQQGHYAKDIELVSPKPTKNQRISALEKEVETLKSEVEALKTAQKTADIAKIAEGITKMFAKEKKLTPNERRKAIIDEAKAFVAENTVFEEFKGTMHHGVVLKSGAYVKPVYWVLPEKRIVEVNMVGVLSDKSHAKGIAKCAPDDVFNEHIGKAIALGRALGLDVKRFEKAVQPSEVVVGMVVRGGCNGFYNANKTFTINGETGGSDSFYYEEAKQYGGGDNDWICRNQIGVIVDDSEAQY